MSTVHFVGAGCGAPDLITVRGMRLLQEADVIVYAGSLINPEILSYASSGCEMYDSAYLHLEQVIEILSKAAEKGKMTVRLHTGDPSIYGAIREQIDRLAELEKLRDLAAHGASMAVFLSASMGERLQDELLKSGGYGPGDPCAVVYRATWPDERKFVTTVGNLAKTLKENDIRKTAIILVGKFLGTEYGLSKLYDRMFSTGFRKGAGETQEAEKTDGRKTEEGREGTE